MIYGGQFDVSRDGRSSIGGVQGWWVPATHTGARVCERVRRGGRGGRGRRAARRGDRRLRRPMYSWWMIEGACASGGTVNYRARRRAKSARASDTSSRERGERAERYRLETWGRHRLIDTRRRGARFRDFRKSCRFIKIASRKRAFFSGTSSGGGGDSGARAMRTWARGRGESEREREGRGWLLIN
jgi:hypothetical protein